MYINKDGELVEGFKTPYNFDTNAESDRTGTACKDPSLAQQHQEEEANINTIVHRFGITGKLPLIDMPPLLDEFSEVYDFQSAMNTMAAARHSFSQLAPEVRDAFNNNPHHFVSQVDYMLADPDQARRDHNMSVLRAWGLAMPEGPKADPTTLGDVLKAIKEQATRSDLQPNAPPQTAP